MDLCTQYTQYAIHKKSEANMIMYLILFNSFLPSPDREIMIIWTV